MPAWLGPAIAGGASLLGGGINAWQQGNMNRRNRNFAREMNQTQFNQNLELWHLNNQYNDPRNQRARLEAAGFNPASLYGQSAAGVAGNSTAATGGSATGATSLSSAFGDSVRAAGVSVIDNFLAFDAKRVGLDNMKIKGQLDAANAMLSLAKEMDTKTQTKLTKKLTPWLVEAAQENVRKMTTETQIMLSQEERAAAMHSANFKAALENVLNLRANRAKTEAETNRIKASIPGILNDNTIKRIHAEMWKKGISPNDNTFLRMLSTIVGPYLDDFIQSGRAKSTYEKYRPNFNSSSDSKPGFWKGVWDGIRDPRVNH